MSAPDIVVLFVLIAFALWGAARGPFRQVLSLGLLALGFLIAGSAHPHLATLVGKVTGLAAPETWALAWALAFFLVLVVGGIVLSCSRAFIARIPPGGTVGRSVGAVLGATHAALLLVIVGYATLAWSTGEPTLPTLTREAPTGRSHTARPTSDADTGWRGLTQGSRAGFWLTRGGGALRGVATLPPWIDAAMDAVDDEIEARR